MKDWYKNKITGQTSRFNVEAYKRFPTIIIDGKSVPKSGWVKTSKPKPVSDEIKDLIENTKVEGGSTSAPKPVSDETKTKAAK